MNGDGLMVLQAANGWAATNTWEVASHLPVITADTNSLYLYGLSLMALQQGPDISYYGPYFFREGDVDLRTMEEVEVVFVYGTP